VSDYATAPFSGYVIPLIGIPPQATECQCDLCHDVFHLVDLQWNEAGNQTLCAKCAKNTESPLTLPANNITPTK
jgi:hypothetical protein